MMKQKKKKKNYSTLFDFFLFRVKINFLSRIWLRDERKLTPKFYSRLYRVSNIRAGLNSLSEPAMYFYQWTN